MRTIPDCINALQGAIGTTTYVGIDRKVANDIIRHLNWLYALEGGNKEFKKIAEFDVEPKMPSKFFWARWFSK